jgi:cellulose synthase/poly-beta-1,6-N-acetylglucosamine synthase-like glycosyltransferase
MNETLHSAAPVRLCTTSTRSLALARNVHTRRFAFYLLSAFSAEPIRIWNKYTTRKVSSQVFREENAMNISKTLDFQTLVVIPAQERTLSPASSPLAPPSVLSSTLLDQVTSYATLLTFERQRSLLANNAEEREKYQQEALAALPTSNPNVRTFAPFNRKLSALHNFTPWQILALALLGLTVVLGFVFFRIEAAIAAIAVITCLYLADMLANVWLAVRTLNLSAEEHIDSTVVRLLPDIDWPPYTVLCPLYHETEVLTQFVQAMQQLDYPTDKLQILLLTEANDSQTRDAIKALHLPACFTLLTVPAGLPQTKPRACNYGLLHATGEYIVIYDAEDIPEPLQLKKVVMTFARHSEQLGCVQAKLNFYNPRQNLLTRWFTAEYSLWFDLMLPGLQSIGVPLPLGGTSNHFRTPTLRALGAWDAFNVTEDCDLGLRMSHYGLKTCVLDSTTYEEANSDLTNWMRQRSRWIKGYMQTYLVYMRRPYLYLQPGRLSQLLSLQLFVGGKTAALFLNPLMLLLLLIYVILRPVALYHTLFPTFILYMGMACLIFGNFFYIYSHLVGCMKHGHYALAKWSLTIPVYWLMASAAAFLALYQLIVKPHHWEKTRHGLHLKGSAQLVAEMEQIKQFADSNSVHPPLQLPQWDTNEGEVMDEIEMVATSVSSNVSITSDEIELEMTEKRVRVKLRTNPQMPVVHPIVETQAKDDEDTQELPTPSSAKSPQESPHTIETDRA